jgi:hypothetical protein
MDKTMTESLPGAPIEKAHSLPLFAWLQRKAKWRRWLLPILLLWLSAGGYLLLIGQLGYYWDDWAFAWISQVLGPDGLARYFETNRPFWGLIYRTTTPLLGRAPLTWQVFGLFWHAASTLALWWALRQVWPRQLQAAVWVAMLYAVYPGFGQRPIALMSGHFYIVLTAFILSLGLNTRAARVRSAGTRRTLLILLTIAGLAFSLVNLLTLEYFYALEAIRPLLLWFALSEISPDWRSRARQTALAWLPYLALLLGVTVWRVFFFSYQTLNYKPVLIETFKLDPLAGLSLLLKMALSDWWISGILAWARVFTLPDLSVIGPRTALLGASLAAFTLVILAIYWFWSRLDEGVDGVPPDAAWGWQALIIGALGMIVAGAPLWLTGIRVGLTFPDDRFTLPFVLGVSFMLGGLLAILPLRNIFKVAILCIAVSLAVNHHLGIATEYRRDWAAQRAFFWHMTWRIPQLEPGVVLVAPAWKGGHYSDNSLTAPLNWIYAPENNSEAMSYMFYWPEVRLGLGLEDMEAGIPITQNYLAAQFMGSTSNMIAVNYSDTACFRVLDSEVDGVNWQVLPIMRRAADIANLDAIIFDPAAKPARPPIDIFGPEPAPSWCYYFEKAELARQRGAWQTVAQLGDQAAAANDNPNDPSERNVFIEGYAHTGRWDDALALTTESLAVTPLMEPVLCQLWARIERQTSEGAARDDALSEVHTLLKCAAP